MRRATHPSKESFNQISYSNISFMRKNNSTQKCDDWQLTNPWNNAEKTQFLLLMKIFLYLRRLLRIYIDICHLQRALFVDYIYCRHIANELRSVFAGSTLSIDPPKIVPQSKPRRNKNRISVFSRPRPRLKLSRTTRRSFFTILRSILSSK